MNSNWKKDYLRYKNFFLNVFAAYNDKPNIRIYLELTLSLLTVTFFSIFAIRPTIITIISLNKEIKSKTETSLALKQKIKDLQSINIALQKEAANIQLIDQAVPDNSMTEVFVKQIEQISTENSMKILGLSASDIMIIGTNTKTKKKDVSELSGNADELPFNFSATGNYKGIINTLTSFEKLRRPIKMDSFVINSSNTADGKILILNISGRIPYLSKNSETDNQ